MVERLTDPAHASSLLRDTYRQMLRKPLDLLLADSDQAHRMAAAFQTAVIAELNSISKRVELLIERASKKDRELELTEKLFIGLARRTARDVSDIDAAYAELEARIEAAIDLERQAALPSNVDEQISIVLKRVADLNAQDRLDDADEEVDQALAEIAQEEQRLVAIKMRMLDVSVEQSRMRGDAAKTTQRLLEKLALEHPDFGQRFDALRSVWQEWYQRGRDKGLNFDLEVSIELARTNVEKATFPEQTSTALNDLGVAQTTLGERETGTERLVLAINNHRTALEKFSRKRNPLAWANTQNELGNSLRILGQRESNKGSLEEAVTRFKLALEELTQDNNPRGWASTQNNLGSALQHLGERERGGERLEQAITAYRAALNVYSLKADPNAWAMVHSNLGNALSTLGERERNTLRLEEAVVSYRAALIVMTRDKMPMDWAGATNNLGVALKTIGQLQKDVKLLEEAVNVFKNALEERTREKVPSEWATTQHNLGHAFTLLGNLLNHTGQSEKATETLNLAFAALNAALEVRTQNNSPFDWASSTSYLGLAEIISFNRTHDPEHLDRAEAHVRAAREIFAEAGATQYLEVGNRKLQYINHLRNGPSA